MTRQEIIRWVASAAADGWDWKPTYNTESCTKHVTLSKRGYTAMANMRSEKEAGLSVWGPDGLAVDPPTAYEWGTLELRAHMCQYCKRTGRTVRIGFAGRCCPECREKHKATVEHKGWDN